MEEIKIDMGRTAILKSLTQYRTYSGTTDVLPTKKLNDRIIQLTMEKASRFRVEVYTIQPKLTPLAYNGGLSQIFILPRITCIAKLVYPEPIQDRNKDFSALTLIWYQNHYAFPIDSHILYAIKNMPWDDLSGEYCY